MIYGHSANGKVVLHVASVVVGQVDHQVYVTLPDQSRNMVDRKVKELPFDVKTFRRVVMIFWQSILIESQCFSTL